MRKAAPALAFLLILAAGVVFAKIPSYRGRFNNLPCLAPYIRQMDRDAPKSIEEAMLLPPYQAAYPIDGIGNVSFPITTKSPELQSYFDQGVALLHAMWYTEAERSFRQLAAADPDCPMAYWGLALANERYPKRASVYMERAFASVPKQPGFTRKEREWLEIYNRFWNPGVVAPDQPQLTEAQRRSARARDLENFATKYPDDIEARAFLLRHLVLDNYRAGAPLDSRFLVDLLAEEIHAMNPAHPSRPYRAFLWLNADPARALDSAREITAIMPGVPDAWRYAAQLYAAAGDYHAALFFEDASLRTAHRHMIADFIMPDEMENLSANYAAHVDTLCAMGRLDEAVKTARRLIAMPRAAYLGEKDTLADNLAGSYATGRLLLFQTLMRHDRWQEIVNEVDSGMLAAGPAWEEQAYAHYWKTIALYNLNRLEAAAEETAALDALFTRFRTEGTTNEVKAEIVSCIRGLRAYKALVEKTLTAAPDWEREPLLHVTDDHLALRLFAAGLKDDALALVTSERAARPGQLLSTANFCDLYARAGRRDEALVHFDSNFRRNATEADASLALFDRVLPMVEALKLRGNWKLPPLSTVDKSATPDPGSLGPAEWTPPEAPAWSLADYSGKKISLEDYRGKPLLINFFLGVGCVFCVEQLQTFKPHVPAFAEAGISVIAISTDSVQALADSVGTAIAEGGINAAPYPFPIVSDEKLEIFNAYRAYSSFEESGLHGTFLISPDGRILWHNVGHDPFMFPEFLLEEAVRLLALHGKEG